MGEESVLENTINHLKANINDYYGDPRKTEAFIKSKDLNLKKGTSFILLYLTQNGDLTKHSQ